MLGLGEQPSNLFGGLERRYETSIWLYLIRLSFDDSPPVSVSGRSRTLRYKVLCCVVHVERSSECLG